MRLLRATVEGFGFVIEPWNAKTVEAELKKRGMVHGRADNDGKGLKASASRTRTDGTSRSAIGAGLAKARKTGPDGKVVAAGAIRGNELENGLARSPLVRCCDQLQAKRVSYYTNLLGWKESYDEGSPERNSAIRRHW